MKRIKCDCGTYLYEHNHKRHLLTTKHTIYLQSLDNEKSDNEEENDYMFDSENMSKKTPFIIIKKATFICKR